MRCRAKQLMRQTMFACNASSKDSQRRYNSTARVQGYSSCLPWHAVSQVGAVAESQSYVCFCRSLGGT
jgi:hypothetical protein